MLVISTGIPHFLKENLQKISAPKKWSPGTNGQLLPSFHYQPISSYPLQDALPRPHKIQGCVHRTRSGDRDCHRSPVNDPLATDSWKTDSSDSDQSDRSSEVMRQANVNITPV